MSKALFIIGATIIVLSIILMIISLIHQYTLTAVLAFITCILGGVVVWTSDKYE